MLSKATNFVIISYGSYTRSVIYHITVKLKRMDFLRLSLQLMCGLVLSLPINGILAMFFLKMQMSLFTLIKAQPRLL